MPTSLARHFATVAALAASVVAIAILPSCATAPDTDKGASNEFPARPAAVEISAIDPCSVLSEEVRKRLGLQRGVARTANVGTGEVSRGCSWVNTDDRYGYNFQTIPTGAADALKAPGSSVQIISGFGAVQNRPDEYQGPGIPPACQLTIDVNDGQAVRVQVQSSDTDDSRAGELLAEACQRSRSFATDVMSTIVDQQH